ERDPAPRFDFCFIDGAKNWTIDSCAFFLADRLLREGAWLLFDDYAFTYADHAGQAGTTTTDGINHRQLGDDELTEPHVRLILELLVMQHPDYAEFRVEDDSWAWARKVRGGRRVLPIDTNVSLRARAVRSLRRLVRTVRERANGRVPRTP